MIHEFLRSLRSFPPVVYLCGRNLPNVKKIIIAVDGFSSCGKSTLAKDLASKLGYAYIDSGAMYRAVTLYFLENGIDPDDPEAVDDALKRIEIRFLRMNGENHTFLNGRDVESDIRQMRVSAQVSKVSTVSAVRRAMVRQQQAMGAEKGIVMDGRDIGTVVFPQAELKLFMTADPDERTRRRYAELQARGVNISPEEVKANLLHRDQIDSTRADSPLRQADGAIVIDSTHLTREEQLARALALAIAARG